MSETPAILLWAFATCIAAVMMVTLVRRRREQLTQQLRDHVGRRLKPAESTDQATPSDEIENEPQEKAAPIERPE